MKKLFGLALAFAIIYIGLVSFLPEVFSPAVIVPQIAKLF